MAEDEIAVTPWLLAASLVLDLGLGVLSIVTFSGLNYCCGIPILSGNTDYDWAELPTVVAGFLYCQSPVLST
jgi:hypothetical protein